MSRCQALVFLTGILLLALTTASPALAKKRPRTEAQVYRNAGDTIGYKEGDTFAVPANMRTAVDFWRRIYTEQSTKQTVLHDAKHLNVIYTVLDFTNLYEGKQYTDAQIRKMREEQTEQVKNYYRKILRDLERVDLEESALNALTPEEKRVYRLFQGIQEEYRFERSQARVRAQVGQRDEFIRGIVDSGGYIHAMEDIFRSYKLPVQLVRLTFVESMFNTKAYSKAHASGIWQFIPSTGRLYMRMDSLVDERNDPLLATHASAKLLMANYQALNSWPLAVTAYNHGRSGMRRAVEKTGETDLGIIIQKYQSPTFGFASRNFYAQLLAAIDVERNYQKYFGPLTRLQPVTFDIVRLPDPVTLGTLSDYTKVPEDELIDLNPALTERVINSIAYVPPNYDLRVPKGARRDFMTAYANIPREFRQKRKQAVQWHRVRSGETLSEIAQMSGVSPRDILRANNLSKANRIYSGQLLKIPSLSSVAAVAEAERRRGSRREARGPSAVVRYPQVKVAPISEEETVVANAATPAPSAAPSAQPKNAAIPAPTSPPDMVASASQAQTPISLFALADPKNSGKDFSMAAALPVMDPKAVPWNFVYELKDPQAGADAPFAGETRVVDGETPGHFAEWCRISTPQLRRLNHLKFSQGISLGQKLRLECLSTRADFQAERLAFHQQVQEEFFKDCPVLKVERHKVEKDEAIWDLANSRYQTPLWLIQKANPAKDLTKRLTPGEILDIPLCHRDAPSTSQK